MNSMPLAGYLALLYFGSEFLLGILRPAKAGARSPADRSSTRVLWILIPVSMFFGFQMEFSLPEASWGYQPWINILGIATVIAGLAFRWYSIIYLGRFFTVNVEIAADHQLIDSGPYRLLRHPSYTGALLAFYGLALCTMNWASLAIMTVGPTAAFLYRIHVEEAALAGAFGERYRLYMQRTARLIPAVY
jgi:protein-S-isoprenylcysteine O-methyltransferase